LVGAIECPCHTRSRRAVAQRSTALFDSASAAVQLWLSVASADAVLLWAARAQPPRRRPADRVQDGGAGQCNHVVCVRACVFVRCGRAGAHNACLQHRRSVAAPLSRCCMSSASWCHVYAICPVVCCVHTVDQWLQLPLRCSRIHSTKLCRIESNRFESVYCSSLCIEQTNKPFECIASALLDSLTVAGDHRRLERTRHGVRSRFAYNVQHQIQRYPHPHFTPRADGRTPFVGTTSHCATHNPTERYIGFPCVLIVSAIR
jgi:hypothetical protein